MAGPEYELGAPVPLRERLRRIYRGTLFQAIIIGLVSFSQPGIWGALNNLGAGGEAEPYVVNVANSVTFGVMIIFSPLTGVLANVIGLRWVLVFGTLGYIPYSAALYCNSVYGTQWFMIFGATTCGLSASCLWTSESAIAVGYPEAAKRGLYIAIWQAINKLGSIIAGAIQLALNANGSLKGSISPSTYLVLIALQCLGLPLALLVSPPEKLIRSDGTRPTFNNRNRTLKGELRALGAVLKRKEILLLLPIFIGQGWGGTYNGNFMAAYFTVRSRALIAFVVAVASMILDMVSGGVFDIRRWRRSVKARSAWVFFFAIYTALWIWSIINQLDYNLNPPTLDWNSPGFGVGSGIVIIYRLLVEIVGVWIYWLLGTYDAHTDTLALTTGILRSAESLGSTFSFVVGATPHTSLLVNLIVSVAIFYASVPTTFWATWIVPDVPKGSVEDEDVESTVQAETLVVSEEK